jgi:hypothetical protein
MVRNLFDSQTRLPGLIGRSSRLLETSGALRLQVLQPNRETKNVTGKIPPRSLATEAQEALKQITN